jgi:polyhydroxyalkanoate synthase
MGSSDKTFVLSEAGHIAGIVNPPSKKKYGHYTNDDASLAPQAWKSAATFNQGSWWPRWDMWLSERSGGTVPARQIGDSGVEVLAPAPGTYVKAR